MREIAVTKSLQDHIRDSVAAALHEDIGAGDLTAQLIPADLVATATITARENAILSGQLWVNEVFTQLDPTIELDWLLMDGDKAEAGTRICKLRGSSRSLLTGERTALNFLQTLSATATVTAAYVRAVKSTPCKILDTRKTIPGLRLAQKYAVRCGGGENHRVGLFDAILLKENHINSAGGISTLVRNCRKLNPGSAIEIEVETIAELREALDCKVERILLDNFSHEMLLSAVKIGRASGQTRAELEVSGGLTLDDVAAIAVTGVDFISVGAITKNVRAIDFSMRFD